MALPRIYQKLFQNEGASRMLRPDIVPACVNVSINNFNSETSGEYTLTGDKKQADGYPYDTSDAVYFKVINTGDELIQYWYHGNVMLVRYKKGTDGAWSSWEQVGKDLTDMIIDGDNELAAQIQQLNVADMSLLGQINSVEGRVTTAEGDIDTNTTDIASIETRLTDVEATVSSNTADLAAHRTAISSNGNKIATVTTNIADLYQQIEDAYDYVSEQYTTAGGTL